ncbi:MAG: hypothetical protein RMI79_00195 [Nitrososphaerota archaeon]|nr:hypothetical protein [Nitrososphaerota archaeon]
MVIEEMPVKEYKTRYVVFEVRDYNGLINILRESCKEQKGFFFKIIRNYNGIIIVKCPHKMVPILKARVNSPETQLSLRIVGVSGTLRKAVSKFCIRKICRDHNP